MKYCVVLGTRPEIIKLSSLIKELKDKDFFIIHTNQHYSENMDKIFFEELSLPKPQYNLNINNCGHGEMTGRMLIEIEKILLKEKPDVVFIQGDTNSVLSGALTASKLGIKVAHIEAGLRSYDRTMPEEINRIITDHISDYLLCPTKNQEKILLKEGINKNKIFVVGNTICDSLKQNKKENKEKEDYVLVTIHRAENTNDISKLKSILEALNELSKENKIILPIHPRTKKVIENNKLNGLLNKLKVIEPVGYLDFVNLENNAKLIITDSGGIQEEACILGIPCITVRENTERPETVEVGANIIAGTKKENIIKSVKKFKNKKWDNPFNPLKVDSIAKKILEVVK